MKSLALLTLACTTFGALAEEGAAPAGSGASPEGDGACLLQKSIGKGADENGPGVIAEALPVDRDAADERAAKDSQGISMVEGSYLALQTCYGFTGGTCRVDPCGAERNAQCQSNLCTCVAACAGPDGKCHAGQNTLVAKGFTLKNAKWPKYSMYFQTLSAFGQLKTTNSYSFLNLGKDQFSLYRLPGNTSRFFLGSAKDPTRVARIAFTAGTGLSLHGLYSTKLDAGKSPGALALSVCYDHAKAGLMFGSHDGAYWAYLHHGSWLVYAFQGTQAAVGEGGLWTVTPSLKAAEIAMLPKCSQAPPSATDKGAR